MVKSEKYIKVGSGRMIEYSVHEYDEYAPKTYLFEEYFIENDEIKKSCRMSKNGKYSFSAWINAKIEEKEKTSSVSYEFDINNPLYIPILHNLLYEQDSYTIYDESTENFDEKYAVFTRIEDKIILTFVNTIENKNIDNKFNISTHDSDPKLKCFFEAAIREFSLIQELDKRQISIEEYMIDSKGIEDEDVKQYIKSYIPRYK